MLSELGILKSWIEGEVHRLVEGENLVGLESCRNRSLEPGAKVLSQDFLASPFFCLFVCLYLLNSKRFVLCNLPWLNFLNLMF